MLRPVRLVRLGLVLMATLAASGCSNETSEPEAAWIAVGSGLENFAPLAEGDEIELVHGPQGGWHVDLAARFRGLSPDGLLLTFRVWDPAHTAQLAYPTKSAINEADARAGNDGYEHAGHRVIFAIAEPSEIVDHDALVEVEAIGDGTVLSDACSVTIVDALP
jgi:hypothetical protein